MDSLSKTIAQLIRADSFLDEYQESLVRELLVAHHTASLLNGSASKMCSSIGFEGSGSPINGVICGLSTLGDKHGPVTKARNYIYTPFYQDSVIMRDLIDPSFRVPGFGHSMYKEKIDPAFDKVVSLIHSNEKFIQLLRIQDIIADERKGKVIPINAAGITACVTEILNLPSPMENWFFIVGRVGDWLNSMKRP